MRHSCFFFALLCLCVTGTAGENTATPTASQTTLAQPATGVSVWMKCYQRITLPRAFNWNAATFHTLLRNPSWNGEAIMDFLSDSPEIATLYAADAFTIQGYLVREHTGHVFKRAEEQFRFFPSNIRPPGKKSWFELFKAGIALHDIGKPVAGEAGDKKRAPEFTVPIVEIVLENLGFSRAERGLLIALIGHDIVGEVAQRKRSPQSAYEALVDVARSIQMDPTEFFQAQLFFYTIDGSSYDNVLDLIFIQTDDGQLLPNKQAPLVELQRLFSAQ
jgi:hypothetical protein